MIRPLARTALLFAVLAACIPSSWALDPDRQMSQYIRYRWGNDRGLSGEVYAIAQTSDGFLWIGTEQGLFRFDGHVFQRVTESGPDAPSIVDVVGLTVDAQGTLLVRLPERNLLRYSNGAFENALRSLQARELAVTAMTTANDGALLVSGLTNGTLKYSGGRFETVLPVSVLPSSPTISLAQSADDKVWLGTRDAGLYYEEHGQVIKVVKGLPSRKISALLAKGSDVWIGTDAGIVRWDGAELTTDGVPFSLRRAAVLSMLSDRSSNLWIGTKDGLWRINKAGIAARTELDAGAHTPVNVLFEDREGSIWFGGPAGIERLSDGSFTTFGRPEGLPSDRNGAVWADTDGRIWVAPIDGGLVWLDKGQIGRVTESGLATDVVYSITGGKDGVWVGRKNRGLTHLYWQGGKLAAENYTQATGLAQNTIYSVYESRDGAVWAGSLNGGLSRVQGRHVTRYAADGLGSRSVASILEDADGTMWFGTPEGLAALSSGHWKNFTTKNGLPSDEINCLMQDSRGVIWIGTSQGPAFMTGGEIRNPSGLTQAWDGEVLGLAEDRSGWVWMVSSKGVIRVDRDRVLRGVAGPGDIHEYGVDDGLRSVEGVKRQSSLVVDPLGRIWASMSVGLSVTDPGRSQVVSTPVISRVVAISADNSPVDISNPARVATPPRRLSLAFSGISLRYPDRIRFRYELEGYDQSWSEPTATTEATYTQLGPGSYRFRVSATNPDGPSDDASETGIALEIEPFYWQTWWFRLGVASLAGLVVLALYRLRMNQLITQLNLRFEERLDERTRIAQEIHDTLLQGFLSASMQLDATADGLPQDSAPRQSLDRVVALMRQVIDEARNSVRGLRSSDPRLSDLPQAFSQIRDELNFDNDVAFRVIVGGHPRPLRPVLRDQVYRIGREALVNAIRHSRAKNIEVELDYTGKRLRLLVRDDGCGIAPEVLRRGREGHWGLPGMRERTERIGGQFHVWSSASAGTEIELSIPSHVAFEGESAGLFNRWLRRRNWRYDSKKTS